MIAGSARWNAAAAPWGVALAEDVLLLQPRGWVPARLDSRVAAALPPELGAAAGSSVVGLGTSLHLRVGEACAELASARRELARQLAWHGLAAAATATHPFVDGSEPTMGLRIRVAIPEAETAIRALNGLRSHLPALVALAANSPFRRGRDTRFASSRVPLLTRRPRTGIPPAFESYASYARVVRALGVLADRSRSAAIVRWDATLQPSTGTLDVTVLDAQTRVEDAAALAALIQCLVRMHAEAPLPLAPAPPPATLDENRLSAARDGMDTALLVDRSGARMHVRLTLDHLVDASLPVAHELGCVSELIEAMGLMAAPGAHRQRALLAGRRGGRRSAGLRALVAALHGEFAGSGDRMSRQAAA